MRKSILFLVIGALILNFGLFSAYAQSDEASEQRELGIEERQEEAFGKPESVDDLVELLKERAKLKMEDRRKELLRKIKISTTLLTGYESNPLNDSDRKGDGYIEKDFSINWQPTFNKYLGADIGYWLINQNYFEQTDLSSFDHALNATLKLYPFGGGKFRLEPGIEYEWLQYPKDRSSSYDNFKQFLKFKHYIGKKWNYGDDTIIVQ